jgi:hypothetical protein
VLAKVRKRPAVSKQKTQRVHMERFNLKKLNEVQRKEQYRVEILNRFGALENLETEVDTNVDPGGFKVECVQDIMGNY